ncbi:PREDICTED: ephexin-1-like [Nanorana parkeri]|uniref:ephexin-1-like n=1 Tax=Nanorana parkeri TaxID=125878 RepID=UPI000853F394|nr:PREDICTED: ephexin-1-like [Nanorana parkeri]
MSATDALPPPIPLSQKPVPPSEQATSGVSVKKIAGLFQKDLGGGSVEETQPRLPPKPSTLAVKEEKTQQKTDEPAGMKAKVEGEREVDRSCPPPLPPKLFQDPDERSAKMASCPPRLACPSGCGCGCHQQRPGFVLVWVPESSVPGEAPDPSEDGGIFQRNDDDDGGGGKWGPRSLKDKMTAGTSYPVRRRSLRFKEHSRHNSADGVGEEKENGGIVLTSYKSTVDCDLPGATCEEGCQGEILRTGGAPEVPRHGVTPGGGDVDSAATHTEAPPPSNLCNGPSLEHTNGYAPIAKPPKLKSISFCDRVVPPTQALCDPSEPPAFVPPKVPSKPPRGAAPPPPLAPPPFLRKGSLKRYSTGNSEEPTERDKKASSCSLPVDRARDRHSSSDDANESSGSESSAFRPLAVKSPKCIDWESHLRDEPLYQTYRQSVINKEIRRQTVSRNSSFTSYDSSQESPLPYGGSPKQGRRSTVPHNTLWQELPSVMESGVLESMSNDEKKMQESMFEVLTSEVSYLRSLNVLTEHFLGCRDLQETLIVREKKILFSNILRVKEVSERFLMDLESRVDEDVVISDICDIIYHHAVHNFPVYKDYVRNQLYQEKTYSELMEKNPQFHAVVCRLQELPQCQRLPFMSFLLLPFFSLNFLFSPPSQNVLKRTEEGSEAEQNASKALDTVSKIIQECNREVGRMRQTEELIHISSKIEFDKIKAIPIISQSRFLEKQGELSEVQQKGSLFGIKPTKLTPVYFFLFNDFLLITQKKGSDRHVVVDYAHRSLVQIQSCPTMENSFFLTLLENHQGKTCDRLFKAPTQSDLHRWVAAFPSKNDDSLSGSDTIYEDWDCPQVHCVEQYSAAQADELHLEPSDIINVLRKTSEGWCEGIRLSDGKKGWFPARYVQEITNEHVRRRNLRERYRVLQAARQIVNQTGDTKKKSSSA